MVGNRGVWGGFLVFCGEGVGNSRRGEVGRIQNRKDKKQGKNVSFIWVSSFSKVSADRRQTPSLQTTSKNLGTGELLYLRTKFEKGLPEICETENKNRFRGVGRDKKSRQRALI